MAVKLKRDEKGTFAQWESTGKKHRYSTPTGKVRAIKKAERDNPFHN
jgi:hypothetical protein